jgi:hypothetical protein
MSFPLKAFNFKLQKTKLHPVREWKDANVTQLLTFMMKDG